MGRYRITPGSSSFNSSSRDTRPKLSSGNLTLLATITSRARNDALTASDRDKLKSLVSALGYKKDRLPLEHQGKIRSAQKAVSASMQRVAAKKEKGQTPAQPPKLDKDGLPPLSDNFYNLPAWRRESILKERESLRKSRLTPEQRAHEDVGDALKTLARMPSEMMRMLNGYSVPTSYRGVPGSSDRALDVLIKQLPAAAETAIKAANAHQQAYGLYEGKTAAQLEKEIRQDQQDLFNKMKNDLMPHLAPEQIAQIGLPAETNQRQPIFKQDQTANFKVPPPRPR